LVGVVDQPRYSVLQVEDGSRKLIFGGFGVGSDNDLVIGWEMGKQVRDGDIILDLIVENIGCS
jgi:hypothetical protein